MAKVGDGSRRSRASVGAGAAERPAALLRDLEGLAREYGRRTGPRKLALLGVLARAELARADEVERFHEVLCFLRAYPDDPKLLRLVERMLRGFAERADLAKHREALESSGIAGTAIRFRFFAPLASWLARNWPRQLAVDWDDFKNRERLVYLLPLLVHFGESPALDEFDMSERAWVRLLKGAGESDASFLIRRFERLRADTFVREKIYDELDIPMVLAPGPGTPSRTFAKHRVKGVTFQRRPLSRQRPDLAAEARRPPRAIREASRAEARRILDLASEAMVTRSRDLDAFSWASESDVRVIDCGAGLTFAAMSPGVERRLLLESVYGFLTMKNGVPIGYVLTGALFGSVEIAYNVFETYRGAEAGVVYGRVIAMARTLFGADTFMIPPYQLGLGNDEALDSGAWWFYRKMGFLPRDEKTLALMRAEEKRLRRDPEHRSSRATLERLSRVNAYYALRGRRSDVLGMLDLPNVGLHVSRYLAQRFGADRELGTETCAREAAELLGLESLDDLTPGERIVWERWGPLVMILPGIARWTLAQRRALAAVVRAKGGRRESDFVLAFDEHAALRRAIRTLAGRKV